MESDTQNNEKTVQQQGTSSSPSPLFIVFFLLIVGLTVTAGILKPKLGSSASVIQAEPKGIMGTECRLGVVLHATTSQQENEKVQNVLQQVEDNLRRRETIIFSSWVESSELSRLNRDEQFEPSDELKDVLKAAQIANVITHQAFDVTCQRFIELWKEAQTLGALPTDDQIEVTKLAPSKIDLGGIAKGYCIDQAMEEFIACNPAGAIVNIGGDIAVYGQSEQGGFWTFSIVNPFEPQKVWGRFRVTTVRNGKPLVQAVCTSGSYRRGFDIGGVHYSHIIDPRTGKPVSGDTVPASVTVLADECIIADVWATALTVLGEEGLQYLPPKVEAFMIFGTPDKPRTVCSKEFPEVLN